jgi:hypothetical protein
MKTKIIRLGLILLIFLALAIQANAICAVKGYVFNKDGSLVSDNTIVNVQNLNNEVKYPAKTIQGTYLKVLHDCIIGQDKILVSTSDGFYYGEGISIANAPFTDINITLSSSISSVNINSGSGKVVKEEKILGILDCSTIIINDAQQFTINNCTKGLYSFEGKTIEFKIVNLKNTMIQGIFSPMEVPIVLFNGQSNEFDLNKNGLKDIKINLIKIVDGKATMLFEKIKEVVPEKPSEAKTEAPAKIGGGLTMSPLQTQELSLKLFTLALILVIIANLIWLNSQLKYSKKKR